VRPTRMALWGEHWVAAQLLGRWRRWLAEKRARPRRRATPSPALGGLPAPLRARVHQILSEPTYEVRERYDAGVDEHAWLRFQYVSIDLMFGSYHDVV
jgi:hypothetical protein